MGGIIGIEKLEIKTNKENQMAYALEKFFNDTRKLNTI